MKKIIIVSVFCLAFCASQLLADEVVLVNGDRITGKIKDVADGKLTIASDMAGTVTIDLAKIATFTTGEPIEVHLKDGTAFNKSVSKSETGKFAVQGDQTLKPQDFNVASIATVNPPPPRWHGSITGALTSTHGNTNIYNTSFNLSMLKRTDIDRTLITTDYFYTKQRNPSTDEKEVTQDEWRIRGKYDYFFSKKLFGFLEGRYERDKIAFLERRVIIGGGLGYQWAESPSFNFWTGGGIASRYEAYTNDTPNSSQMSIQLSYHLDKQLAKNVAFIHDLTYYPSLEKFSDYFLTTSAEVRCRLTDLIFTNFRAILDFDSTPANGKGKSDVKYILGVGMTF